MPALSCLHAFMPAQGVVYEHCECVAIFYCTTFILFATSYIRIDHTSIRRGCIDRSNHFIFFAQVRVVAAFGNHNQMILAVSKRILSIGCFGESRRQKIVLLRPVFNSNARRRAEHRGANFREISECTHVHRMHPRRRSKAWRNSHSELQISQKELKKPTGA